MITPILTNKDHNTFVQDYLAAMLKERYDSTIEGAIEVVQEYWGQDNATDSRFHDTPKPPQVKRSDAIHQLFNKLGEELNELPYLQVMWQALDRLHHDFAEHEIRIREDVNRFDTLIPDESLSTWIDG